jgi:hypothetical protein
MSVVPCIINLSNKQGDKVNEDNQHIQELFDQFHSGEMSVFELMEELETERFDGDIIDFL